MEEELKEPTVSEARKIRDGQAASGAEYAKAEALIYLGLSVIYLAKTLKQVINQPKG